MQIIYIDRVMKTKKILKPIGRGHNRAEGLNEARQTCNELQAKLYRQVLTHQSRQLNAVFESLSWTLLNKIMQTFVRKWGKRKLLL